MFCAKYTSEAVKSVQQAKHLKCGFQGPRWGSDKNSHMAWCLIVDTKSAKFETDARAAKLKLCPANGMPIRPWCRSP